MKNIITFILLSLLSVVKCSYFPYVYPRVKLEAKLHGKAGNPLILTPYLKKDLLPLARNLSKVPLTDKIGFPSYSGFFTVDEDFDSNMFFWYFPPFSKNPKAPVLLWLQGGPGGSSMFGLFTELGPLIAKKEGFRKRKYHWALNSHLIFIDNPVGTGFSYTKDEQGYCNNEDCVAKNLYNCLQQFFTMFPDLLKNEFFLTGESYAGKYIPALGMEIHQQNQNGHGKFINLKGLAIGNGYCDPINQMQYGKYLYQHGLLDNQQLQVFEDIEGKIKEALSKKDWAAADVLMDEMMDGELKNFSYFKNYTGFNYYYNFLKTSDNIDMTVFMDLLAKDNIRRSIHIGGLPFNSGKEVQLHLALDILQSVAPLISNLLSHYRILFYNGQLDIIVAYPLTVNFLRNLKFNGSQEYESAKRRFWKVDNEIAGYVKSAGNMTEVLVRNAGHMVPHDQPKWALDLITRFIRNKL